MPHYQVRFNLLERIQRHADYNQKTGAAEEEVDIGAANQDPGQNGDTGKEYRSRQGNAG